jgi:hypothetical protein
VGVFVCNHSCGGVATGKSSETKSDAELRFCIFF